MIEKNKKVYIAGSSGMVGGAIERRLRFLNYENIISRTSTQLDLLNQSQVDDFFRREKPQIVILAAGKVGGILANDTYRAEFIYNNLMIEANVIHASYKNNAEKLVFLGSSCIYPKFSVQPIREEELLTGQLEPTNEPYAIAKIAGIKLCENYYRQYGCNFFSAMPTNLYGVNDNYDLENSHVIPALIRKFYDAKINGSPQVKLWGTGLPRREFMFVEDLADAVVFLLENINADDIYKQNISQINVGTGEDIEIGKLAGLIKEICGYEGKVEFDANKPDGTPVKLLDVSRLHRMGWKHKTTLEEGLLKTLEWYVRTRRTTNVI